MCTFVRRVALTLLSLLMYVNVFSRDKVLTFEIREDINSTAWTHVSGALAKAAAEEAEAIVVHLNTYGGELVFADSIRTALLASKRPVYAVVDVNAASAGERLTLTPIPATTPASFPPESRPSQRIPASFASPQ